MLDEDLNLWLIEVNSSPAMDPSTKITQTLCAQVLRDTVTGLLACGAGADGEVMVDHAETLWKRGATTEMLSALPTGMWTLLHRGEVGGGRRNSL